MRSKNAAPPSVASSPWLFYIVVGFVLAAILFVASRLITGTVMLVRWMTDAPTAVDRDLVLHGDSGGQTR
jgi:hypothetical protein